MTTTHAQLTLRDLGDGLVLRRATAADTDALADFNARIHSRDPDSPDRYVGAWTRDLMCGTHPTVGPSDFTIVEDTRSGAIVSTMNLISQTWTYGGVPFGIGRPEIVGTHPDYRNRGLVRAQFDVIHAWSAARGEKAQVITGIPWYYRQFGYEMALDLGGGRVGYKPHLPPLKAGETEPYRVRPAAEADLPFLAEMHAQMAARSLVAAVRDADLLRFELGGWSADCVNRVELRLIETAEGAPVGLVGHAPRLWGTAVSVVLYEVRPGVSWLAVTPSVLRYVWAAGEALAAQAEVELTAFRFSLGASHPVYAALPTALPRTEPPYAFFVRVADLPDFVRHVAPVLEQRLATSVAVGHTGELRLSFYRSGLRLAFERGRVASVEAWTPSPRESGDAAFPDRTFLQMLFGYRSLDELRHAFPDCWTRDGATRALLDALFPKQLSYLWPVS